MVTNFTHLHVHTEYSLLDGLSNIKKLLEFVKNAGMNSLAITDHGAMYGTIEFYKEATKAGIKPIIGIEGYITDLSSQEATKSPSYHIILLAKNDKGYRNLMKLISKAHLEGYYYRPRFSHNYLKECSEGLICTSACAQGEILQNLINQDFEKAKETARWYLNTFSDDYYLEIQRHLYDQYIDKVEDANLQQEIRKMADNENNSNKLLIKLSRELGIPLVATNDVHYIRKEDAVAQDALVCIATGKTVSETKRLRFVDTPTFYVTTQEEMTDLFKDLPEAVSNTQKVADKTNLTLELGKWYFPKFEVPQGKKPDIFLKEFAKKKLGEVFSKPTKEIIDRLNYELDIICDKGYAPYFLIVWDLVSWANQQGIVTNTRGSAAGSLVSFLLGITTVDPIKYYLPFERFLNPSRPSPPDIDFDVSDDRRDEIINYICDKYGSERVAQICTFGRMLSRAAVRDIARVLGYPYAIGDKIAKLIPPPKQGFPVTIPKAIDESEELKNLYNSDSDTKKILNLGKEIEGNARHISVHAAGVVVAPTKMTDFSPIQKEPSGEKIITQYEMHACEDVGLIKFDILGIRNLSILGASVKIVNETLGNNIDLGKIPLDDKKTFEMLGRGETMGTFQLNGAGMTKYLKELKPTRVEDLMAMVALYRPGPIAVIPEYIRRKKNPKLIKYLDKRMEKYLGSSFGLIVYQDDLLFSAIELAGYSWEEADKFRKAVGKKIPEEMAAQKEKFIQGIIKNGQTEKFAEDLWKLFEPFQAYGFNKAHAASYGLVAYQTAYMKANYPVEFMTALLTAESNDTEKISQAINECKKMGIKVHPPDINFSQEGFQIEKDDESLEKKAIRFGLNAIKNVGAAAISAILGARKSGEFLNYPEFLSRIDGRKVNKKVLESLIKVGALSMFGKRSELLSKTEYLKGKMVKNTNQNQQGLFSADDLGKVFSENNNLDMNQMSEEFSDAELETLERQLLGFSLSGKPIGEVLARYQTDVTHHISEVFEESEATKATIAGVVREVKVILTKKTNQQMAFIRIEDETGNLELVVFPSIFVQIGKKFDENQPVMVTGKINRRDDDVSLIVETLTEPGSAGNYSIKIPRGTSNDKLKSLKRLFLENQGEHTVDLLFEGTNEKVTLPISVKWSHNLSREVNRVLSEE